MLLKDFGFLLFLLQAGENILLLQKGASGGRHLACFFFDSFQRKETNGRGEMGPGREQKVYSLCQSSLFDPTHKWRSKTRVVVSHLGCGTNVFQGPI